MTPACMCPPDDLRTLARRACAPRSGAKARGTGTGVVMKVRDREVGRDVEVRAKECLKCSCYWPRPDPGTFVQGRGYSSRPGAGWICGTREIHGCPPEGQRGLKR